MTKNNDMKNGQSIETGLILKSWRKKEMNNNFGLLPTKSNLLEVINGQKSVTNLTALWGTLSKTEQRATKPFFAKRKDEILRGKNVL